jgi:hypothetical protein
MNRTLPTSKPARGLLLSGRRGPGHKPRGVIYHGWLAVSMFVVGKSGFAQEAVRNLMAADIPRQGAGISSESQPFTIKSGDFRLLATPSLGLDYNDNVFLTKENAKNDVIVRPALGLAVSYPVTQQNLLQLDVGFGYQQYLQHDQLSTWYVQSGSAVSFDIFVKDFTFNIHDRFSYVQDASQEAQVANTGSYGTLNNTAGGSGVYRMMDCTLTLGYDHQNVLSTSERFKSQDHASELITTRAGFKVNPALTSGVEGTVTITRYDYQILNDNTAYSAGLYADWQPDTALHISARGGYSFFDFQQTSSFIATTDLDSWYLGLTVQHQITDRINYTLSVGHDIRLGIQSDATEEWYVTPAITWNIVKNWSFQTSLSYQHGKQGQANRFGNLVEAYDWLTLGLGMSQQLTDRLSVSLNYRFTWRDSDVPTRMYEQNLVQLQLNYRLD